MGPGGPPNWAKNLQQGQRGPKIGLRPHNGAREDPKIGLSTQNKAGGTPKASQDPPQKPLTASSSNFFILRSVFIFPEPLPWKRWECCRNALGRDKGQ